MFMKEVVDGEQGGALGKSYDADITYSNAFEMFGEEALMFLTLVL
jgi:hypothetical protein